MTKIRLTDSEELRTGDYADPSTCSYVYYTCTYCLEEFQLVNPFTFQADEAIRHIIYRNEETNEIVTENRSVGVCRSCAQDMMRKEQEDRI
jgi:hypothetical protein